MPKHAKTYRLSDKTVGQIADVMAADRITATEVIIRAVDAYAASRTNAQDCVADCTTDEGSLQDLVAAQSRHIDELIRLLDQSQQVNAMTLAKLPAPKAKKKKRK